MSKGLKRFIIICAIVVGIGVVLAIVGGITYVHRLSDRLGEDDMGSRTQTNIAEGESFDSVSVTGSTDVKVCRAGSQDANSSDSSSESTSDIYAVASYPEDYTAPSCSVESGVLSVDAGNDNSSLELTIYVPDGQSLKNLEVDTGAGDVKLSDVEVTAVSANLSYGDVEISSLSCDNLKVKSASGDVEGSGIVSGDIDIALSSGDVELSGEIAGDSEITTNSGDLDIESSLSESSYTVEADTYYGEVKVGRHGDDDDNGSGSVNTGTGPNLLKLHSDSGDIEVEFGM